MSPLEKFKQKKTANIQAQGADQGLKDLALAFMRETGKYDYTYNFSWMGIPVIQFPQDLFAVAEIIFETRPDFVVETGIAHGGGLVFYASMLELLKSSGRVIGVDIALRDHNRTAIQNHSMAHRIELVDGSSIAPEVIEKVSKLVGTSRRVLVILDSGSYARTRSS